MGRASRSDQIQGRDPRLFVVFARGARYTVTGEHNAKVIAGKDGTYSDTGKVNPDAAAAAARVAAARKGGKG